MSDIWKKFSYENINKYLTYVLVLLLIWGSIWSLRGEDALPPNGYLFNILLLFVVSYLSGELIKCVGLPPLLAMLITGFIIGNVFELNLDKKLSAILRSTALVIILLRAGLGLDPKAIVKLSTVCVRLSFIPCLVETLTVAVASHLLLGFPIVWGALLGFVLAAVSPAVVVPGLILLQEKGFGVDKGVPTLVIAAASIDDVLAITGFGLCIALVFDSKSSLLWNIMRGPVEVVVGVALGALIGFILWYIPSGKTSNNQRLLILLLSGIFSLFGSLAIDMGGAGPLACLVVSFVAALKWRQHEDITKPIQRYLKTFWLIFQPLLFALIGTEVKLSNIKPDAIGWALMTLALGLTTRIATAMTVVFGGELNLKEKLFIGLAWLPKATVQAAVGPIALDMARDKNDQKSIELANLVLTIAVLAIVITAPIGAIAIAILGPKCLNKQQKQDYIECKDNAEETQPMSEMVSP